MPGTFADLHSVSLPSITGWPANQAGFLDLYDWDSVILSRPAVLSHPLDLCTGILPCALSVRGDGSAGATLLRTAGGAIRCLASAGCWRVGLESLAIACGPDDAEGPILRLDGSTLALHNVSATGCASLADGALLSSSGPADVRIVACAFRDLRSGGRGGALKASGGRVAISNTTFDDCSSATGGGAIWATAYFCTRSDEPVPTSITVSSSRFENASSAGGGGAVLVTADVLGGGGVTMEILSSSFEGCSVELDGGAVHVSGAAAHVRVVDSEFVSCRAGASGGAISVQNRAQGTFLACRLFENRALGLGGGAFHASDAALVLVGLRSEGNSAVSGGGGVVYWEGGKPPTMAPLCPEGAWTSATTAAPSSISPGGSCSQCAAGTYQTGVGVLDVESCKPCPVGHFSGHSGAALCAECPPGTFSGAEGATSPDACLPCGEGTFSEASGATQCRSCPHGTYTNTSRATACIGCPANDALPPAYLPASCILDGASVRSLEPLAGAAQVRCAQIAKTAHSPLLSGRYRCPSEQPGRMLSGAMQAPGAVSDADVGTGRSSHTVFFRPCPAAGAGGLELARWKARGRSVDVGSLGLATGTAPQRKLDDAQAQSVLYNKGTERRQAHSERQPEASFRRGDGATEQTALLCGEGNSAVYGSCVASSYKELRISAPPTAISPGLPFSVTVLKIDAYNQTVLTDSSSVLQAFASESSRGARREGASYLTILGASIVRMRAGKAEFTIAVKPFFAQIDAQQQLAKLARPPTIYFEGPDSLASSPAGSMRTRDLSVQVRGQDQVCPPGYILSLDPPTAGAYAGACTLCPEGTYSLNPLFGGTEASTPSCISCPLQAMRSGDCAKGGAAVNFSLGTWQVVDWMYRLVGCPQGHQLINTVDGAFSNPIQQCLRCGAAEYVLDPSNAGHHCRPCPKFLTCNGTAVQSRYPGALVVVDSASGAYQLGGCPPGYELQGTDEDCALCPPLYYCTGSATARAQCPHSTFSSPGANSSRFCAPCVFVNVAVVLPNAAQDFGAVQQQRFADAVAAVARVPGDHVLIVSVVAVTRRGGGGVQARAGVAVTEQFSADAVVAALQDAKALTSALALNGLSDGSLVSVRIGEDAGAAAAGLTAAEAAGVAIGVFCLLLAVCGFAVRLWFGKRESAEERELRLEVKYLRERLRLGKRDGFFLSYEGGPLWRRRERTVFLLRNEVEAAARLSLLREFDLRSFDAFCHCLEYSVFILERSVPDRGAAASAAQYVALCEWLLEVACFLIEPSILKEANASAAVSGMAGSALVRAEGEVWTEDSEDDERVSRARFRYFKTRVAAARIWVEHDRRSVALARAGI